MSKNIFKQKNLYYFLIPFVFFCIFSLISITLAQQGSTIWQEPTATPPNGNVSAPLNVGNVTQTKTGGLNIYGNAEIRSRLYVKGHVGTNAELTLQKGGTNPNNLNYPQFSFMATEDTLRLITRVYSFNNMGGLRIAVTNATTIGVVNINGNVGIGTTNPTAKLEVAGNIKIADGTQGSNKVLTSDANGLASWKSLSDILSTTNIAQLTVGKICLGSSSCIENWNDITNQTGTNYWTLSGNNLYPTSTNYNIGIGTTNPTAKLDVNGQIRIKSNENNDNYGYIGLDSDNKSMDIGFKSINIGLKEIEFHKYDLNKNYVIELDELNVAKTDRQYEKITLSQYLRIAQLYNLGSYNNIALTDPYDIKEVGGIININSQIRIKSNENNDNYGYIEFDSDNESMNIGLKGKEFHKYDLNKNYVIESDELDVAKEDFNKGKITFRQLLRIIQLYNLGSYNNIALTDPYDIKEVGGIININNSQIRITGGNPGLNKVLTSDANGLASWKSLSDILSTTNIAQLTVGKICLGSSSCIENWNDITNQTGTNYWTLSGNNLYPTSTSYSVGIGTSNPSKKLTVFANKASDGLKIIREGGGTGSNAVEKTGLSINMGNLHPWIDYVGGIAFIPIDNYNELGNWQTNPTYSLYLSSKGNVGIGTTKVFSNQDAKFDAQLQIVSSDLDSFADLFLGKKGVNEAFSLRAGGDGNISFHIRKVNFESGVLSNDYFTIISNGNVGIGTNDPSTKLDVVGNIKVSGTSTNAGNITATGIITAKNFCITGSNNCLFSLAETVNNLNTSITNITNIINKGITGSGTENYLAKFGAGGKTIGNSIIYETSTGNVGIGTNNPAAKLDVRGIVSTSNGFVVSDGTDTFVSLGNDNNRNLELRSKGGTPYIDFSNDTEKKNNNYTTDFDMRIILTGNDTLEVQGGDLKVSGKVTGTELCIGGDCKKSWPTGGSKTERIICTYSENYFTYFDKNSGTLEIENQCKIKRDTESKDNKNYILGCPSGYRIVSGGPWCDGNKFIRESRPDSLTSWKVSCRESYFSLDISNKTTPNGASIICEK